MQRLQEHRRAVEAHAPREHRDGECAPGHEPAQKGGTRRLVAHVTPSPTVSKVVCRTAHLKDTGAAKHTVSAEASAGCFTTARAMRIVRRCRHVPPLVPTPV